jgi:hypothetical protein
MSTLRTEAVEVGTVGEAEAGGSMNKADEVQEMKWLMKHQCHDIEDVMSYLEDAEDVNVAAAALIATLIEDNYINHGMGNYPIDYCGERDGAFGVFFGDIRCPSLGLDRQKIRKYCTEFGDAHGLQCNDAKASAAVKAYRNLSPALDMLISSN